MKRVALLALFALVVCSAFGATYWVNIYNGEDNGAHGTIEITLQYPTYNVNCGKFNLNFSDNIPGGIAGKYYIDCPYAPCSAYNVLAVCRCFDNGNSCHDSSSQLFVNGNSGPYQLPHCYLMGEPVQQPPQNY